MRLSGNHNAGELKEITGAMGSSRDRIDSCMALICAVFVKHVPLCTFVVLHSRRCLRYAVSGDIVLPRIAPLTVINLKAYVGCHETGSY